MKWKISRIYRAGLVLVLSSLSLWAGGCGSGKAPDPPQEAEGAQADQNMGE
jgi:hypothetical protein